MARKIQVLNERGFHHSNISADAARNMIRQGAAMPDPSNVKRLRLVQAIDVAEPICCESHGRSSSSPTGGYLMQLALGNKIRNREHQDFIERDFEIEKRVIKELQLDALVQCGAERLQPCSVDMRVLAAG